MNQKKILLILCVVLVAVLGAYIGVRRYTETKEYEAAAEEAIQEALDTIYVTEIDSESVVAVSWYCYYEELAFELDGESWIYTDDSSIAIDSYYIESVLSTFCNMTAIRELVDGEDLAGYGLEEPLYYFTLTDDTGEVTTYYIGDLAGEDYYLTINDKTNIYTVSSDVVTAISYGIIDMVVQDTFEMPASEYLETVSVTQGETETQYTVDDDGAFDMMAGGLSVLTLTDCVDANASDELAVYGIDEETRITWTMSYYEEVEETTEASTEESTDESTEETVVATGDLLEATLYIGSYIEAYDVYYVQVEGSNLVYSVAADTVDMLLNQYVETEDSESTDSYDLSAYFE